MILKVFDFIWYKYGRDGQERKLEFVHYTEGTLPSDMVGKNYDFICVRWSTSDKFYLSAYANELGHGCFLIRKQYVIKSLFSIKGNMFPI